MVYWIYKDARDEWRWYLKSDDGEKIADSGKGYKDKYDCEHDVELVKGSANTLVYTLAEKQKFRIRSSVSPFDVSGGERESVAPLCFLWVSEPIKTYRCEP